MKSNLSVIGHLSLSPFGVGIELVFCCRSQWVRIKKVKITFYNLSSVETLCCALLIFFTLLSNFSSINCFLLCVMIFLFSNKKKVCEIFPWVFILLFSNVCANNNLTAFFIIGFRGTKPPTKAALKEKLTNKTSFVFFFRCLLIFVIHIWKKNPFKIYYTAQLVGRKISREGHPNSFSFFEQRLFSWHQHFCQRSQKKKSQSWVPTNMFANLWVDNWSQASCVASNSIAFHFWN